MITLSKIDNAIRFTFANSQHYLTGDGTIDVPVNSLSLIFDESDFATFRKAASNDIFVSAPLDEFGMTKAELITFYTTNMVGSTGGGGGGGVTSGEVQTMIDNSISGKAETSDVTSAVTELNAALSGETTRAMASEEALSGAVSAVTDALEDKVDVSELEEVELAVAQSINVLAQSVSGKQDTLVYYSEDTETNEGKIGTSVEDGGVTKSSEVRVASNIEGDSEVSLSASEYSDDYEKSAAFYGTQDGIEISYNNADNVEGTSINHMIYVNGDGVTIETNNDDGESVNTTEFSVTPDGVTINGDEIVTESDLTASLSGKQDTLVAGSGITISGNVISAEGGGSVIVDPTLDSGSTNPVANSAITAALSGKADSVDAVNNLTGYTNYFAFRNKNNNIRFNIGVGKINGVSILNANSQNSTNFELATQDELDSAIGQISLTTSTALNNLNDRFDGMRLKKLTQAQYDALSGNTDSNTLYIITNVVNNNA